MASDTTNQLKLTEDLWKEVLFRSAVKSLLRLKCVSKQWYALIRNHEFTLEHLQYQKTHNKGRLFLKYYKKETQQDKFALFDDENLVSDAYNDIYQLTIKFALKMEGPINGLYCLFDRLDRIVLWNPALMEFRTLPLPHPNFYPHLYVWMCDIGFGIDPIHNDYKIVLFRSFTDGREMSSHQYVHVYKLNTNTWRLLHDLGNTQVCSQCIIKSHTCSFLNGTYYWWELSGSVFAFDMGEEIFREILGPTLPSWYRVGSLSLYDDKIALVLLDEFAVDIWIMLEESVWILKFTVTSLPKDYRDVGLWKDNGLLFATNDSPTYNVDPNSQTVLCNFMTREMRNLGPRASDSYFQASVFYESLVSLYCWTKHKEKKASLNLELSFLTSYSNPYLQM